MTARGRRLRPQVCRGHWEDHLPPLLVLVWSSAFQQHRTTVGEICKQQELSAMAKNGTVTFSRTRASFLGETQPAYSNPRCPPTSYGQSQCLIKAVHSIGRCNTI